MTPPAARSPADVAADRVRPPHGLALWLRVTAVAAFAATAVDAVLLQYRRSYFTGGFLASDYLTSVGEGLAFFAGSVLADAAVAGLVVWVVLTVFGRRRATRGRAVIAALALACAPILAVNFVEYQLLTYLGDAFDLRLLFDLAGQSPGEFLAVSSAHVWRTLGLALAFVAPAVMIVWMTLRRVSHGPHRPVDRLPRSAVVASVGLLLAALAATTLLRSSSDVLDNGLRRKPTGRLLGAVVHAASDLDGDGFGVLGRPEDPSLLDARVRPYGLDEPGNGIDEDGVAGDLPATAPPYSEEPTPRAPWHSRPDIVLIVLESFRAEARGARLNGRPVTPVLDALAASGVAPEAAYSHNGYTVQSRRHLFTGSVAGLDGGETLIDDFKRQGYEVAYFSGQDESFGGPRQGIGFERADVAYDARADRERRYSAFSTAGSLAVPFSVVQERVKAFLDGRDDDRPLFLYVNFHDTHFPYHHRLVQPILGTPIVEQARIAPDRADAVRNMYMNTAANVDRAIGEVLDDVRQALGRAPGVIVLSDHGESLFDENFLGHGYALNDAQTRIPVVVANLPLIVQEPFAQSDLRSAIGRALSSAPAGASTPRLTRRDSSVFQYLGLIERPAQIALTGRDNQIVYDFRADRVRTASGRWRRPGDLAPKERAAFVDLVQTWERMMLARRAAGGIPAKKPEERTDGAGM